MRTPLPRRARFNSDEALIEFARRAGGIKMSEDRQILDMMIQRKTGEIILNPGGKISPMPIDPSALLNLRSLQPWDMAIHQAFL
jgi:hypothetical protein